MKKHTCRKVGRCALFLLYGSSMGETQVKLCTLMLTPHIFCAQGGQKRMEEGKWQ